jgi:hypothetical protein
MRYDATIAKGRHILLDRQDRLGGNFLDLLHDAKKISDFIDQNGFCPDKLSEEAVFGMYRGGRHELTKGPPKDKLESHHMPPKDPKNPDQGPAVQMEIADHMETPSWGSRASSIQYRLEQEALIKQGKLAEAIQRDIDFVTKKFPGKYDEAIREMLRTLDQGTRNQIKFP